jgi:hypothetical protein
MGVLDGVDVSLDNLIGYSRLQELLEELIRHIRDQEQVIAGLKDQCDASSQSLEVILQRLGEEKADSEKVAASSDSPQDRTTDELAARFQLQEERLDLLFADVQDLKSRPSCPESAEYDVQRQTMQEEAGKLRAELMQRINELMQKTDALQENCGEGLLQKVTDLQQEVKAMRLGDTQPSQSAPAAADLNALSEKMRKEIDELWPRIERSISPLEAMIKAIDAKVESQISFRISDNTSRISDIEKVVQEINAARDQEGYTDMNFRDHSEQMEARLAALGEMKQEMRTLTGQLSGVVNAVGALEGELQSHGDQLKGGGDARLELADNLNRVSKLLEGRMASVESKLGEVGDSKDITDICDTLKKVEAEMRELEAKSTKDMQPRLESQAGEVMRLRSELSILMERMTEIGSRESMATTQGQPHCLVCAQGTRQATNKVIVGSDGKTYLQGSSMQSMMQLQRAQTAFGDKLALQGGAGAPLRKYRIPVGTDGIPTWGMVKGLNRQSASTGSLSVPPSRGRPPMAVVSRADAVHLPARSGMACPPVSRSLDL